MALVFMLMVLGPLLIVGTVSLNTAVSKHQQISIAKLKREAFHLADMGLIQGAVQLKQDDNDGFEDVELTATYPLETVTVNSDSYNIHRWIDTITVDDRKKFKVWLTDNDDTGYAGGLSNDTIVANDNDEDLAVVLISQGWVEDGIGNVYVYSTVKGLYKRVPYKPDHAVVSGGDINLQGNISVLGSEQSIHTNSNFSSTGGGDVAEGEVTATGTVTGVVDLVGGGTTGIVDVQVIDIPAINPEYYRSLASNLVIDISNILTVPKRPPGNAGDLHENFDNTECLFLYRDPPDAATTVTIEFSSGCPGSTATVPLSGVVYINGNVIVSITGQPWSGVIIASGDIEFLANASVQGHSDLEGVAAVSGGQIIFSGAVAIGSPGNQLGLYTASNFDYCCGGNKTIYGPTISSTGSSLNSLSGNITIIYDSTAPPPNGPLIGKLISWTRLE